jgi:hypothetical protein
VAVIEGYRWGTDRHGLIRGIPSRTLGDRRSMDTEIRHRTRATTFRRAGWLVVASMIGLALAGPGAGIASASHDPEGDQPEPTCDETRSGTLNDGPNTLTLIVSSTHTEDENEDEDCESTTTSSSTTSSSTTSTTTSEACEEASFTATVNEVVWTLPAYLGRYTYPLLTVKVTAPNGVPDGCEKSWSLNSYTTQGPTWETSGTQALFDHDSITLDSEITSGTLTVEVPPCYGQTDFYEGTTRFDGKDGPLPNYPDSIVPSPGLIAYSNGGNACTTTTTTSSTTSTTSSTTSTTTQFTTQSTTTQFTTQSTTTDGGAQGATGTPKVTPPPTDTLPVSGTPGGDTWRVALLAIAVLLGTLLLLAPATPAKARRRR